MRLTLALILTFLSACADLNDDKAIDRTGGLSTEERDALYEQVTHPRVQISPPPPFIRVMAISHAMALLFAWLQHGQSCRIPV